MESGSLEELKLTRSVIKHIQKKDKSLQQGTGVGDDYSHYNIDDKNLVFASAVSADMYIAWVKAINNIVVSGAKPFGAMITVLLNNETEEKLLKKYMELANMLADKYNIQIMGGHTQVSPVYKSDSFCITMVAETKDVIRNIKEIKPDCDIVMVGNAGCMGSDLILKHKEDELRERFASSYLDEQKIDASNYCLIEYIGIIKKCKDIYYMHDISTSGLYGALWQMSVKIKKGFEIDHGFIPINQGTIEISEFFNINPYLLDGTGAMLVIVKDAAELVEKFENAKIPVASIGKITDNHDKVILYHDADYNKIEKRFLTPAKGDEIYKVLTVV